MLQYTELQPSHALAKHLECIWFLSSTESSPLTGATERVLPDGCVEWIFHLGQPFQRSIITGITGATGVTGEWERQPRSFVVGELTRFLLLQLTGAVAVMGVRFRPWALVLASWGCCLSDW